VPVTVLELEAGREHEVDAQALTNELRQAILDAPEHSVTTSNPSLLLLADRVRCSIEAFDQRLGPDSDRKLDEACQRRMATRLDVRLLVWGHLYEQAGVLYAKVHLYRDGKAGRVVTLPYERARRSRVAQRLYAKLLTPERAGDVRVQGDASFAGAELFAGNVSLGAFAPGLELTVASGPLELEARREGRVVARANVTVAAEKMTEARLVFVPRTDIDPSVGFQDPPPVGIVTPDGRWKQTAGFVGVGLGAALIGAGIFATLRAGSLKSDFDDDRALITYRSGLPDAQQGTCAAAEAGVRSAAGNAATPERVERLCTGVETFRAAQVALYGAGALVAGAGIYLLVTTPNSRRVSAGSHPVREARTTWSLLPWAGPTARGLSLHASFFLLLGSPNDATTVWHKRGHGVGGSHRALLAFTHARAVV
jgi:hypothetical protein